MDIWLNLFQQRIDQYALQKSIKTSSPNIANTNKIELQEIKHNNIYNHWWFLLDIQKF